MRDKGQVGGGEGMRGGTTVQCTYTAHSECATLSVYPLPTLIPVNLYTVYSSEPVSIFQ